MTRWLAGIGVLVSLACAGVGGKEEEPAPAPPAVTAPPPPPPPAAAPTVVADGELAWPLAKLGTVPADRTVALPPGHTVVDLDLDPRGTFATVVTSDGTTRAAWTWSFGGPLLPVTATGVEEVAFSAFDDAVYLLARGGEGWTIDRGRLTPEGVWASAGRVYTSTEALSALIAPFTRWDGEERVFFARARAPGKTQVLGVRRSGLRPYEVTSPDGLLGTLTAEDVRVPAQDYTPPPIALAADTATPLSLHPATGALLWKDGAGAVHARAWSPAEGNWGADAVVAPTGHWTWSPNGYYAVVWEEGATGVRLRDPTGVEIAAAGPRFRAPPVTAENGRTLLGWTDEGLRTVAVTAPLAAVRSLTQAAATPGEAAALAASGMHLSDTTREQLHEVYDDLLYADVERPVFASVDGMLEVLHVGFQAVFVQMERDVSRPRLAAFLTALDATALRENQRRVREVALSAKRMLDGDYDFPEGQQVLGEAAAQSELHGELVDFADFHPRGPYATSPELENYFRAFKYIDLLKLNIEERAMLSGDDALVAAWRAWIDVQAPYLSGSRYQGLFGEWTPSPHARADCVPKAIAAQPKRVFPLSWGRDAEALERVTAHELLPASCGVKNRGAPSGLDLLTAFGSDSARAAQRAEYAQYPSLEPAHTALRGRFGAPIDGAGFVDDWMRLVQILGNETRVPEGVDGERWRRRLWETALASWTNFRHTTVLVNEASAAQMGAGGPEGFELLTTEPVRAAVDPVPAAWAQLADLLDRLAAHAKLSKAPGRVPVVLAEGATAARRLGTLAERQMRDEPLSPDEYAFIRAFAGTVEHPYLLLAAAAAGKEREISAPDPMMRIVDVHSWKDPVGRPMYWHAAVGRPRRIVTLLGDRGVLLPTWGAVYSFYEVASPKRLDDAAWRKQVDRAARPPWANRSDEGAGR